MSPTSATPTSTYRLHLTGEFTLHDAADLIGYLSRLGVDWAYASPIQTVPAGATHGYHILDPDQINPELGGDAGLRAFRQALDQHGLGLVLDIVPNHLGASPDNPWWWDVLAHGPDSAFATYFDIDWQAGPIVLPVLGGTVHEAIADGSVRVSDGQFVVHDTRLPLAPDTDSTAPIEDVLAAQHYRLFQWRDGEAVLNWRRFFAVNELAGVRVEDPAVFDAVHRRLLALVEDGTVDGLRVDHIDGLRDPGAYLAMLRQAIGPDRWLVVEKIVEQGETLPHTWPVHGTTGYETGAAIQALLVDLNGHAVLRRLFADATGLSTSTVQALPDSKRAVLDELFGAEVVRVVGEIPSPGQELDLDDGIRQLTAHLDGYRTYAPAEGPVPATDQAAIHHAARAADPAHATDPVHATDPTDPASSNAPAQTVADLLLTEAGRPALLRWQQLTGPAAAKGFEDRLLFRHVALASLCEVGADAPYIDQPPGPGEVGAMLTERARRSPLAGSTTSTHDSKRSEDVRARLLVLAEIPDQFADLVEDVARAVDTTLDAHAQWLILQAIIGSLDLAPGGDGPDEVYRTRLRSWTRKALREADLATSHRTPDHDYEAQADHYVDTVLRDTATLALLDDIVEQIAVAGATNSLAMLVLKLAAPGVPDIYRGCEIWDDSLTDPDNRRPLDVGYLKAIMDRIEATDDVADLLPDWRDGALKMWVTRAGLHARQRLAATFCSTICTTPDMAGPKAAHVAALLRQADTDSATDEPGILALAARLPHRLSGRDWPTDSIWTDTAVHLAVTRLDGRRWTVATDLLTGRTIPLTADAISLADAFKTLPVALLELS